MIATGCSTKTPVLNNKAPQVRQDLPVVDSIRGISSMTTVGLEWRMVPDLRVEGYRIYRKDPDAKTMKLKQVAEIKDRYSSHFVDTGLKPGSTYVYQMATFDENGNVSPQSSPVQVRTMPMIHSVSFVRAITDLPNRIKIIWRPHQDFRVVGYIVERASVSHPEKWEKEATIKHRLSAEYIDKTLGDGEVYMYRVRCKLCNGEITDPSEPVKAITKPLPMPPSEIKASMNLPKRVHLTWKPSATSDVVYYKVYRAPFAMGFYSYRAKVDGTAFDDHVEDDGATYYYKVTAVDKDGLESPMPDSPVVGSTLGKPLAPTVTSAMLQGNRAVISWAPVDTRADHYRVIRTYWNGLSKVKKSFTNIRGTTFTDTTMMPGIKYTYTVLEVDPNGIVSDPSRSVELYIPKPDEQ